MDIKVDASAMRRLFRSREMQALLVEHAQPYADRNSDEARSLMHGEQRRDPYVCEGRTLNSTSVAVIHSTTKAAAAVGRAYGLPHW